MYRKLILLVLIIIIILLISVNIQYDNLDNVQLINVEVKGAVKKQELVSLPLGSTINDLILNVELNDTADLSSISLNTVLYNNMIVVIPSKNNNILISINSSDIEQLCMLPGIGTSTANKIIEYRNKYGSFTNLEELKNVSGIGEKKYEKIKEYICL